MVKERLSRRSRRLSRSGALSARALDLIELAVAAARRDRRAAERLVEMLAPVALAALQFAADEHGPEGTGHVRHVILASAAARQDARGRAIASAGAAGVPAASEPAGRAPGTVHDASAAIEAFLGSVRVRLQRGAIEYADRSFERPLPAICDEICEELLDVAGWAFVAHEHVRRRLGRIKRAMDAADAKCAPQPTEPPPPAAPARCRRRVRHQRLMTRQKESS